jgi:hypothetical protein
MLMSKYNSGYISNVMKNINNLIGGDQEDDDLAVAEKELKDIENEYELADKKFKDSETEYNVLMSTDDPDKYNDRIGALKNNPIKYDNKELLKILMEAEAATLNAKQLTHKASELKTVLDKNYDETKKHEETVELARAAQIKARAELSKAEENVKAKRALREKAYKAVQDRDITKGQEHKPYNILNPHKVDIDQTDVTTSVPETLNLVNVDSKQIEKVDVKHSEIVDAQIDELHKQQGNLRTMQLNMQSGGRRNRKCYGN